MQERVVLTMRRDNPDEIDIVGPLFDLGYHTVDISCDPIGTMVIVMEKRK